MWKCTGYWVILRKMWKSRSPKNSELFLKFCKSLVRPVLEYCSPVGVHTSKKAEAAVEKVQRKGSKCTGCDMPHEERLKFFKWPTLHQSGLLSLVTECYKTVNRLNGLHPSANVTFAHDFRPLRANHCFQLKYSRHPQL